MRSETRFSRKRMSMASIAGSGEVACYPHEPFVPLRHRLRRCPRSVSGMSSSATLGSPPAPAPAHPLAAELALVSRVTDRLVQTLDFEAALHHLLDGATELLGVERASLMLLDTATETLTIKVARGIPEAVVESTQIRLGEGIAGRVAATGEPLMLGDAELVSRLRAPRPEDLAHQYRDASALSVPLTLHGRVQGVMNFAHKVSGAPFQPEDLSFARLIANQSSVALFSAMLHQEYLEKQELEEELRVARTIQKRFLPTTPPRVEGFRFAARCRMSSHVGGDYCGFVALHDGRLALAVGDVEGHGLSSALLMANARASLLTSLWRGDRLVDAVAQLNHLLLEEPASAGNRFMTLLVGVLDGPRRRLGLLSAGHPMPLLLRDGRLVRRPVYGSNIPVGVSSDLVPRMEEPLELEPGDRVVMFTDGLLEARDPEGGELGLARLGECLETVGAGTAEEVAEGDSRAGRPLPPRPASRG